MNYRVIGWGQCKLRWYRGLLVAASVRVCSAIALEGVGGRGKVWHRKLGAVYVYSFPNILVVVCYDTPKVGAKPSIEVRL
jgi:hypothetical protein